MSTPELRYAAAHGFVNPVVDPLTHVVREQVSGHTANPRSRGTLIPSNSGDFGGQLGVDPTVLAAYEVEVTDPTTGRPAVFYIDPAVLTNADQSSAAKLGSTFAAYKRLGEITKMRKSTGKKDDQPVVQQVKRQGLSVPPSVRVRRNPVDEADSAVSAPRPVVRQAPVQQMEQKMIPVTFVLPQVGKLTVQYLDAKLERDQEDGAPLQLILVSELSNPPAGAYAPDISETPLTVRIPSESGEPVELTVINFGLGMTYNGLKYKIFLVRAVDGEPVDVG